MNNNNYIRISTCIPKVYLGKPLLNVEEIIKQTKEVADANIVLFPELLWGAWFYTSMRCTTFVHRTCCIPPYIAGSSPARIPRAALDSHPSWPIKEREEAGGGTRTRIYPRDLHLHHAGPFLPCMCVVLPPAAQSSVSTLYGLDMSPPRSCTPDRPP